MNQLSYVLTMWLVIRPYSFIYVTCMGIKLAWLKWRYHGINNVPVHRIPTIPVYDELVKHQLNGLALLTNDCYYICGRLGLVVEDTRFGGALHRLIVGGVSDVKEYDGIHRIANSENRRKEMVETMIRLDDVTARRIDHLIGSDTVFSNWLNE